MAAFLACNWYTGFCEVPSLDSGIVCTYICGNRSRPLKEGERRTIGLELTVPFGCGTAIRDKGLLCEFDINVQRVEKPGNNALASVIENSCSVDPIRSTNGRTSVSVVGKITPLYKEESATTHLKLKTPSRSIQFSSFWTDYEIGLVTIQLVKNTTLFQSKSCSSANDPRIRTFDGTRFYLDHADVYTLYTDFNNIEVQIQTEDCGRERRRHGPFCTCGVVVRAGRTVFEISHCESLTWHIGFTACGDDGDVLQVRRQWGAYKIHLPTGNTVTVNIHNSEKMHFLNVDVMSSVNDFGKSRGMCGKLSATTGDDRVKKDGSSTTSDEDFAESWRVNEENNLFNPDVIRDGLSHYKPLLHYCTCEDSKLTCTARAAADIPVKPENFNQIKPKNCAISKRKKRMALNVQKRSKRQAQTSQGWFNGWNETLAQAYCDGKFSESKAVEACEGVPGVNVAYSRHDCVNDIKLSGSVDFVSMAVESVYVACFSEALVNPALNTSMPGNSSSVLEIITEKTCTQDCSNRGVCDKGQCRCNPGFGGGDCSIELSRPPTLFDFGEGDHCDLARGECIEIAVLGDIFSGEEFSRCQIKKTTVQQDGRMDSSSVTISTAVSESISEVSCYLPEASADDVTVTYNISVSNTGTFYSNELTVLVYDSTCVSVNQDTMIWNLRDGYCTHKGKCVPEGGTLEDDPSLSCEIIGNKRTWKRANGGKGVSSAGKLNGHRAFGFFGLFVAAATALGHSQ